MRTSVVLVLLFVPALALADLPSVRVTRLEGDRGRQDERALSRALRDAGIEVGPNGDVIVRGEVSDDALALRVRASGRTRTVQVEGDSPRERARLAASEIVTLLGGDSAASPAPAVEAPVEDDAEAEADEEAPEPTRAERAESRAEARAIERARSTPAVEPERGELSALTFELVGGALRRNLAFRDDLFGDVSDYSLPSAPTVGLSASWFPGAHVSGTHPLSGIGIAGEFRSVIAVSSESATGERFETRSITASIDGVYRVPVGAHAVLGRVGYGRESFLVEPAVPAAPSGRNGPRVPRSIYRYVRIGADADLRVVGPFRFGAHAGLRILIDAGDLDAWFPRRRGSGLDLGLHLLFAFDVVTMRFFLDYTRYAFSFDPRPGDTVVVGGASDQWLTFGIAIGVRARAAR